MPQVFRAARPKAFLAPLLLLVTSGCVTLDLKEATRPFPGRQWQGAPRIAVAEVADRRPDPGVLGRVGWNSLKISGNAGAKLRNALMASLNEHAYNVQFVGPVNVLDPADVAAAVRDAKADFLLTAAVLDIRAFSVDPFFDPADVDFTAQVNLLDPEGRTIYTRHIHVHEDKRLWFNPAFGARDMLDDEMERVADFVSTDAEMIRVVSRRRGKAGAPALAAGPIDTATPGIAAPEKPISSTQPTPPSPGPPSAIPLSEIPESAPPVETTSPAEAAPPAEVTSPEEPPLETIAPPEEGTPPEGTLAPGEEAVPATPEGDSVFLPPGGSP